MPNTSHTPGPWYVQEQSLSNVLDILADSSGTLQIAGIDLEAAWGAEPPYPEEEFRANARLIAAAPDLLALLKKAALFVEADVEWHGADALPASAMWLDKASALLARIEGGQS